MGGHGAPPGDALVVRETKRAWRLFARLWRNYWWTTETIGETIGGRPREEHEINGYPFTTSTDLSDFLGIILRVLSDDLATMLTTPSGGPREPRGGPENLGRRRVPEVRDTERK